MHYPPHSAYPFLYNYNPTSVYRTVRKNTIDLFGNRASFSLAKFPSNHQTKGSYPTGLLNTSTTLMAHPKGENFFIEKVYAPQYTIKKLYNVIYRLLRRLKGSGYDPNKN
jgi:hypothetical protein